MEPYNHTRQADKAEIRQLLRTFGITESVTSDLKHVRPILIEYIDHLLDDFYGNVMADPIMSQIFHENNVSQSRAKAMQRIHWLDWVFTAKFNAHYLARCKRIGRVHQEHGILPVYYLYGYQFVSQAVKGLIFNTFDDPKLAQRLTQSVEKAIFLDVTIAISVYCTEMSADWRRSSLYDELTNILNRRGVSEKLEDTLSATQGNDSTISVGLLDIDHFKKVNDSYGHDAGDQVLKFLAKLIVNNLRDNDIVGRWGGEEFIIYMPDTGRVEAISICNRLLAALESSVIKYNDLSISITASIGISELSSQASSFDAALRRSDKALYQAKAAGRNRVMVSPHSPKKKVRRKAAAP